MELNYENPPKLSQAAAPAEAGAPENGLVPEYVSMVDPFLVEALQNPRHRLTNKNVFVNHKNTSKTELLVLRMELDVQKFIQNTDLDQFEFPPFPTSYLRLAAHRVAQHYGLQTMVQDSSVDGQGTRILVLKKPESKFPVARLSEVPAKQSENDKLHQVKIVIKPRPSKSSLDDVDRLGLKRGPVRTVEERKEEYDRARARIFSSPSRSGFEHEFVQFTSDGNNKNLNEKELITNLVVEGEKDFVRREIGNSSRVAILKDRMMDLCDPDYDRSYDRYVKTNHGAQSLNLDIQRFQSPIPPYDPFFPQPFQTHGAQSLVSHRSPVMNPYCVMGFNQMHRDASSFIQWPTTQSMMYTQSYDPLRHGFSQAHYFQQPLRF